MGAAAGWGGAAVTVSVISVVVAGIAWASVVGAGVGSGTLTVVVAGAVTVSEAVTCSEGSLIVSDMLQ